MFFRTTIHLFGDNFKITDFINKFSSEVNSLNSYSDGKDSNAVSFYIGKEFYDDYAYDKELNKIVDFIRKYKVYFLEIGVDEFWLMTDVYHEGTQCNFELFNDYFRSTQETNDFQTPISVYRLNRSKYKSLANEANQ